MISAVDTSVLLDVFQNDARFGAASAATLEAAHRKGKLIACPVVWAEVRAFFPAGTAFHLAMAHVEVEFVPFDAAVSLVCGELWREYRRAGGTRERVLGDFLVGAHALACGGRLLSRDSGFYRRYFRNLEVLG